MNHDHMMGLKVNELGIHIINSLSLMEATLLPFRILTLRFLFIFCYGSQSFLNWYFKKFLEKSTFYSGV